MYEIRKDGGVIALAEAPNYIRRHADGFYILCEEKDAQGVAVDGAAYCLMGRTGLDELEEVQIVERDAGTIILQQGKDATMSRTEIETALCDIDAANEEAHASYETALCDLDEAMNGGETARTKFGRTVLSPAIRRRGMFRHPSRAA